MKFYRIKEICFDLGISYQTLYVKVNSGKMPPLEHPNPANTRVSGYSESTFKKYLRSILQVDKVDNLVNTNTHKTC